MDAITLHARMSTLAARDPVACIRACADVLRAECAIDRDAVLAETFDRWQGEPIDPSALVRALLDWQSEVAAIRMGATALQLAAIDPERDGWANAFGLLAFATQPHANAASMLANALERAAEIRSHARDGEPAGETELDRLFAAVERRCAEP